MRSFKTRIDLSEKVRHQVIPTLQQQLVNAIDLNLQAKQAHWNVKGPSFIALHELFDKIAEESEEYVDLIAERIMQFGGTSDGTIGTVSRDSRLTAYPLTASTGSDHVNALAHALAVFGEGIRKSVDTCDELDDKGSADIFTEISRGVDKFLWFVEAHVQSE